MTQSNENATAGGGEIGGAPAIVSATTLTPELGAKPAGSMTPDEMIGKTQGFETEFNKYVLGYPQVGRATQIALLTPGNVRHIYALGMPGTAKTHSMKTTSYLVHGLAFNRIQCHSDLTPSELVGGEEFDFETRTRKIIRGLLEGRHLVLADEITRATPKAQGGMLEAMAEGRLTIPGVEGSVKMEDPFLMLATANPADQKGVYPLPEAQLDRFLFQMNYGYVEEKFAKAMLLRPDLTDGSCYGVMRPQLTREELLVIRSYIKENVHVSEAFIDYLYEVVDCTRPGQKYFEKLVSEHPDTEPLLSMIKRGEDWGGGAGPRAEQCLVMAAKVFCFLYGGKDPLTGKKRMYVVPSDLEQIFNPVLRGRLILKPEAKFIKHGGREGITKDMVINVIREKVKPYSPNDSAYQK